MGDIPSNELKKFELNQKSLIVDIGCNDGITLKSYPKNTLWNCVLHPVKVNE